MPSVFMRSEYSANQLLQPLARGGAVEAGVLFDRGDAARAPVLQHGLEQGRAVAEAAVEAALGDAEVFGQNLHPHPLDAGPRDFLQAGLDPALAAHLAGPRVCFGVALGIAHGPASPSIDTVPYC